MKCVLTVAGLGTRLLPITKEIPKEMMPVYDKSTRNELILKPMLQVIYESLYRYNIRDFCFIVGKTKRAVKDYFVPDFELVRFLRKNNKDQLADILDDFFGKLKKSHIVFIYQPKPIGFGNAIQYSRKFVKRDYFLLHAGDDLVLSKNNNHLRRLEYNFKKYKADIACLVEKVENPSQYGVIKGPMLERGVINVQKMQEKPKKPISKYAIIAIYIFKPTIFQYLEEARKIVHPEKQLAEAFNIAIKDGAKMIGVLLNGDEKRLDIGTPETYTKVLFSLRTRH